MATNRYYTPEEEKIIYDELLAHYDNIKLGLTIAAQRIGRTYESVKTHWYKVQSRKFEEKPIETKEETIEPVTTKISLFRRILNWLGL